MSLLNVIAFDIIDRVNGRINMLSFAETVKKELNISKNKIDVE
ncbi:MAG: hypothetical protein U9N10_11210 [Bacillota bacterium]|nr:hypothetical protein [Bacillota bacterium]